MRVKGKFQTALHLLFPPRCVACGVWVESDFGLCAECWAQTSFLGGVVCDVCGRPVHGERQEAGLKCDECLLRPRPWQQGRAALSYSGAGRSLILALKHGDRTDVVWPAAKWMALSAKPLVSEHTLVVPVPLHRLRFLKRRYNQAALLAGRLAKLLNCSFCPDGLVRTQGLGSLEGLGPEDRMEKLKNAIHPNPRRTHLLASAPILLVDDVLTTGATLSAATNACFAANAKDVRIVTLARVAKDA